MADCKISLFYLSSASPINTGVLSAAGALKDFECDIVDIRGKEVKELLTDKPQIAVFFADCVNYNFIIGIIKQLKQLDKKLVTILVGSHATATASYTMNAFDWIDIIVKGYPEPALMELATNYDAKKAHFNYIGDIRGIAYKLSGKVYETAKRQLDLRKAFFRPSYQKMSPLQRFVKVIKKGGKAKLVGLPLVASRGYANYRAYDYNSSKFERTNLPYAMINVDDLISQMIRIKEEEGVNFFSFEDDNLASDKVWLREFCEKICGKAMAWNCNARIASLDEDMLTLMSKANCIKIAYTIESGSASMMKLIEGSGYDDTLAHQKQVMRIISQTKERGIQVVANMMVGFPGETKHDMNETVNLATKLTAMGAKVVCRIVKVLPGSKMFEESAGKFVLKEGNMQLNVLGIKNEIYDSVCPNMKSWVKAHGQIFTNYLAYKNEIPVHYMKKCAWFINSKLRKDDITLVDKKTGVERTEVAGIRYGLKLG